MQTCVFARTHRHTQGGVGGGTHACTDNSKRIKQGRWCPRSTNWGYYLTSTQTCKHVCMYRQASYIYPYRPILFRKPEIAGEIFRPVGYHISKNLVTFEKNGSTHDLAHLCTCMHTHTHIQERNNHYVHNFLFSSFRGDNFMSNKNVLYLWKQTYVFVRKPCVVCFCSHFNPRTS